jgi:hypothetical protein
MTVVVAMALGLVAGPAAAQATAQPDEYSIKIVGSAKPNPTWQIQGQGGISVVDIPVIVRCPPVEGASSTLVAAPWAGLTDYFPDGHLAEPFAMAHGGWNFVPCTGKNERSIIRAATIHNRQYEAIVDPVLGPIGRDFEYFSHGKLTAKVQLGPLGAPLAQDIKTIQVVLPRGKR